MKPAQYRKKPVVIEALLFDGTPESGAAVAAWAKEWGVERVTYQPEGVLKWSAYMRIETLEGVMIASPGDWVIRGVKGEFYPCKPDIFEATYEPVAQTEEKK